MPSLKQYRDQIASVKSTKKITKAMKMVAAAKLRKAQEKAEKAHPYAAGMASILSRLAASLNSASDAPKLLTGTGHYQSHLIVLCSSDRGLCGGFNANIIRSAREHIRLLQNDGRDVKIMTVGRKAKDALKREYKEQIIESYEVGDYDFSTADSITKSILNRFESGEFDVVTLMFNAFQNILVQTPTTLQLIPFQLPEVSEDEDTNHGLITFEPNEEAILNDILPRNIAVQVYGAMLDSSAGEQAARMTAMDNATRNAGDMISKLTLTYNRARQAHITKELIEIISGAEAV